MSRVVVLSGPSAVGKSTVVRCLRERVPDLYFSVSATTRVPRPGEVDGVDYAFVSTERFQQLIDDGELLEWAEIHGGLHRSGTPTAPVRDAARLGRPVLISQRRVGLHGRDCGALSRNAHGDRWRGCGARKRSARVCRPR